METHVLRPLSNLSFYHNRLILTQIAPKKTLVVVGSLGALSIPQQITTQSQRDAGPPLSAYTPALPFSVPMETLRRHESPKFYKHENNRYHQQ